MFKYSILIVLSYLLTDTCLMAQVSFQAAASYNNIWDAKRVKNKLGLFGYRMGLTVEFKFAKMNRSSVKTGILMDLKGYKQKFDSTFKFNLRYTSIPLQYLIRIHKELQAQIGVEMGFLVGVRSNTPNAIFNGFNTDLEMGLNYRIEKNLNYFCQANLGLIPLINYYELDKLGNFVKRTHDIRFWSVLIGFNFKFNDKH